MLKNIGVFVLSAAYSSLGTLLYLGHREGLQLYGSWEAFLYLSLFGLAIWMIFAAVCPPFRLGVIGREITKGVMLSFMAMSFVWIILGTTVLVYRLEHFRFSVILGGVTMAGISVICLKTSWSGKS